MAGWHPDHHVRLPVIHQRWRDLTFLHWRYPPETVQALLPPGLQVDTFDGSAWVGITPFTLTSQALPVVPTPHFGADEVNVRTYVRRTDGTDGLWFFSLDFNRAAVVVAARATLGLAYRRASISVQRDGNSVRYLARRGGRHRPHLRLDLDVGDHLTRDDVSDLEVFLVGRWQLFTRMLATLLTVPVEHQPWPLRDARVVDLSEDLLVAAGLTPPDGAPHVLFSPGVDARVGVPRPTR
ncbi:MAG: DUF2071 domain-containing protein [Actinomycetota bacterium]|nr:DUF2071 domain-containing protein [Actinomycetota bacterium]